MSVLPKIAAALTKHLSPVASSSSTQPDGRRPARPALKVVSRPEQEGKPSPEDFKRFEPKKENKIETAEEAGDAADAPAAVAAAPRPLPSGSGVASTLLELLERIRLTGAALTKRKARRTYVQASESKSEGSRFKKGSMIDTEGG